MSTIRLLSIITLIGNPALAQTKNDFSGPAEVQSWFSSEFHPADSRWYTDPWGETDPEWAYRLSPQPPVRLTHLSDFDGATISVDPSGTFQTLTGIGTSFDETSCFAIQKGKTDAQIKVLLKSLIDPQTGAGYSLFRICFGTSDFSDARSVSKHPEGWYTYQDDPNGSFSIENDRKLGIIRVIKLAQEVAKESGVEMRFVATAWSSPAWMKTGGRLASGDSVTNQIRKDMLDDYAVYLRKAVEAYGALGIPIFAVTTNNEHYYTPEKYPGCFISAEDEAVLVRELQREFQGHQIETQIWIHDHNWDLIATGPVVALKALKAAGKYAAADAVAFHHYAGTPADMSKFHDLFPDKDLQFTEGSVWGVGGAEEIVQILRHWSRSYLSWVPMSTQTPTEHNQGPYNTTATFGPTLLIQRDGEGSDYYRTPEYFLLAQFSRFLRSGALRIESNDTTDAKLPNVAFRNPDGSIAVVVVNRAEKPQALRVVLADRQFVATVPAITVATFALRDDENASQSKPPS